MGDDKKAPSKVEFKFRKAEDYRTIYANGAWGGPTAKDEIRMELFIEKNANTDAVIYNLSADGTLLGEVERTPRIEKDKVYMIREIQAAVIMSPQNAKIIADWLLEKVALIEKKPDKK